MLLLNKQIIDMFVQHAMVMHRPDKELLKQLIGQLYRAQRLLMMFEHVVGAPKSTKVPKSTKPLNSYIANNLNLRNIYLSEDCILK